MVRLMSSHEITARSSRHQALKKLVAVCHCLFNRMVLFFTYVPSLHVNVSIFAFFKDVFQSYLPTTGIRDDVPFLLCQIRIEPLAQMTPRGRPKNEKCGMCERKSSSNIILHGKA